MIEAVIAGRAHYFDPEDESSLVGKGGEADVFWLDNPADDLLRKSGNKRLIFKLFHTEGKTEKETQAIRRAADERQEKLPALPRNIDANVVTPIAFGHDRKGRIIGYVMAFESDTTPLVRFLTAEHRRKNHITIHKLLHILRGIRKLIVGVHKSGVVISDMNDENFLVRNQDLSPVLIDVDSTSYGKWSSRAFTAAFICPLILKAPDTSDRNKFKKTVQQIRKAGPHTEDTDWYAFCVILFLLLARYHPYLDGVHNPEPGKREFQKNARIHMRISGFDPRVTPPTGLETAIPWQHWPPALLEYMQKVFAPLGEAPLRCPFPEELLSDELWIVCPRCNTPHGHVRCPDCGAKGIDPKPVSYSTAPSVKKPRGERIAISTVSQGGEMRGVYHFNGAYRREDGTVVLEQPYNPAISALVAGNRTVLRAGSEFVVATRGSNALEQHATDNRYGQTTVAANSRHVYWINGNALVRDGRRGDTVIEWVTSSMTSVWAGETFGVAAVQAGIMTRIMTFDAERLGWQGTYTLPLEFGTVTDMHCIVGDDYAWLLTTVQTADGTVTNKCYVFDRNANLRATAEAKNGDGTWLGTIPRAASAIGDKLIVALAGVGIVQIGITAHAVSAERTLPDTAKYVNGTDSLVSLCRVGTTFILTTTRKIFQIS